VWYVIAAYLVVTVLFGGYVWTLLVRQRTIAELAEATGDVRASATRP
jgi:hypothetical protein